MGCANLTFPVAPGHGAWCKSPPPRPRVAASTDADQTAERSGAAGRRRGHEGGGWARGVFVLGRGTMAMMEFP